jgi:hypothetical protein
MGTEATAGSKSGGGSLPMDMNEFNSTAIRTKDREHVCLEPRPFGNPKEKRWMHISMRR